MRNNLITPSWLDLITKNDDELREILSELNPQSLRKLTRESIQTIVEHKNLVQQKGKEINKLHNQLDQISELAKKR